MSKERLTKTYNPCDECNYAFHKQNQESGMCKMCEFKNYRNLEEQGLLLRLPCKVGDKAWYVHKGGIDEVEVDSFMLNVNLFVNVSFYIAGERFGKTLTPYKTLFFTQSEAEEKLRELEGK